MANCSMCGIGIPDGQGVCSMCYGDPFFGNDGYYLAELMREVEIEHDLKKLDEVMEQENEPLDDEYDEANELPFYLKTMEYLIINKTYILKRIEVLEKRVLFYNALSALTINPHKIKAETELKILKEILPQKSIPLLPEIEKAFDAGQDRQWGISYKEYNPEDSIELTSMSKEDYISNLKLDI